MGMSALGKSLATAASAAAARALLGAGAVGEAIFAAASTAVAQTALGASTLGKTVLAVADAAALRAAAGATTIGSTLLTAADAVAARVALGATTIGAALFLAADAAAARLTLDVYQRGVYSSGGLVTAPKVWRGSATTNALGVWSADISSAGFSSIACVTATMFRNTATAIEILTTQVTSVSNTTVTGVAGRGANIAVLGDTWRLSPTAMTVYLRVEGT
jgi:hypothetical protein